jgi:hypothetical protein
MGDLKRWYQYVDRQPAMCVAPKVDRTLDRGVFVIRLNQAYMLTDPVVVREFASIMADHFQLGLLTVQRFSEIRSFLEDGIDELIAMKPHGAIYDDAPKVVGEGVMMVGGEKVFSFDVTDKGLMN